jgi:hypothetical protein
VIASVRPRVQREGRAAKKHEKEFHSPDESRRTSASAAMTQVLFRVSLQLTLLRHESLVRNAPVSFSRAARDGSAASIGLIRGSE